MLYIAFELVICFFAIIGVMYLAFGIVDTYTTRKCGAHCSIVIDRVDSGDIEYAIRIIEGIVTRDELYGFVDSVVVPREVCDDDRMIELLGKEFGNIKR